MITGINAKKLAAIYNIHPYTLFRYIKPFKETISELATKRELENGKKSTCRNYNDKQLHFIVFTILGDTPEGYEFKDGTLVKTNKA